MKNVILLFTFYIFYISCFAQTSLKSENLKNNLIINVINPGIDYEWVISEKSLISTGIGIGYSGAYEEITKIKNNGFNYVLAPFIDIQYKFIYNRTKLANKGKSIKYNSGNFISIRAVGRGNSITENITRTDNFDFAVGPTWGFQRSFQKIRLLVDIGPQYYFDTLGNNGFFPIMIQLNFGFNLSKS